jgi:hypothetical protein
MIPARAVEKRIQRGFLCDPQRLLIGWRRRNRARWLGGRLIRRVDVDAEPREPLLIVCSLTVLLFLPGCDFSKPGCDMPEVRSAALRIIRTITAIG